MTLAACIAGSLLLRDDPDYSRSKISSQPVGGVVCGEKFMPRLVRAVILGFDTVSENGRVVDRARKIHLEFCSEDAMFPKTQAAVIFTLDPGRSLSGQTVSLPNLRFGSEEDRACRFPRGARVARGVVGVHLDREGHPTEMLSEGCSGRMEFGQEKKGRISGRIVMVFARSLGWLNGRFTAEVKRLSQEKD